MSGEETMASDSGLGQSDGANVFCYKSTNAKHLVEFHDQVQTSVSLLDSLEDFLSTFQKDLSAVSGQISDLQERSKDIENRLKARRRIEKPLSSLLSDLGLPPQLVTIILDTDVGEPWLPAIGDFEKRLTSLKSRKRVKAAKDLTEVSEGLRIVAATKIRGFFMSSIQPIRTSMSTNMQVLQMAALLKYEALYTFLQHHAPSVSQEVQWAYVSASRVYYETGFRRYTRSLSWIKTRITEKSDLIAAGTGEGESEFVFDEERLSLSKIDGKVVTLGYMADNKTHKEPVEALFRSLLLVLMDNATAEYTFITSFFGSATVEPTSAELLGPSSPHMHVDALHFEDRRASLGSDFTSAVPWPRTDSIPSTNNTPATPKISKEEQTILNYIWRQIMGPALAYCQNFAKSVLESPPSVVPLLIMIRLIEDVITEVQRRECTALEGFLFGLRLQFWPVFQKLMSDHIANLNKLTDSATGGYFKRGVTVTDTAVQNIAKRYVVMFSSLVILTDKEEETVIFSNLDRLRQGLSQLIVTQSNKFTDRLQSATYQSVMFETLLQSMSKGQLPTIHPKAQTEIVYWREREEEARRRIGSTRS